MATDPVQQTTDAVTKLLELNRKRKGTTTKDSDSEQDWYDRWLESVTLQLQVVKELSDQDLRKLKQRLDYGQEMKKIELEYDKLAQKTGADKLKAATKILDTRIKVQAKYSEKVRSRDEAIIQQVEQSLINLRNEDPVVTVFQYWQKPVVGADQVAKPLINRDDPAWETTFLATVGAINEKSGEIFVFNDDNTINIAKTRANLNDRELGERIGKQLYRDMDIYNAKRRQTMAVDQQMAVGQAEAERLYAEAQAAISKGDDRLAKQKFEAAQEAVAAMDLNFELKSGIISEAEAQELQDKVDFRRRLQKEAGEIIDYAKNKLGKEGDDEIRSGLAKGVGNSGFRAWAADHGFDRLGRVELDEDGDPIVSTYVEGGDDVAALLAWKKQSMRRPGNYGIKAISSGEIWRVEMKDGTSVTGRRLLRHAADPMGAIRIVTEDGARVITPAEVSQAAILKKPKPKLPRIDKRAQKIHQQEKGEYERLDEAVLFQSGALDLDELAYSDGYLQDADGNYIRSDVRDAAQERARKSILFYATVDGKGYVVDGASGRIFAPGADGKFVEVEGEAAEAVVQGLPPENERVPMLRPAREGDVVGAVEVNVAGQKVPQTIATSADLDSFLKGEFPPTIPSEDEVEAVNALRPQLSSDAALGYTPTPDEPPERVTGEGSDLAGIYVIDSPVGEGPPISDQQELAFDTALDQEVLKQDLESDLVDAEPEPTGGPRADKPDLLDNLRQSLTDESKSVEERQKLANIYNEQFGDKYFLLYGTLKDDDLGFELPKPIYTPPPRKDDKPPAAEQPVAPPPKQPSSTEETGADTVATAPVPAAVMAPVTETGKKPGVGQDKQTSLKTVPMADAGTMSLNFKSEAGPPEMPDESPSDGGITNVGDVGVPNIFGRLKRNRDEKKGGQAESGGGEQTDSVSKDAEVNSQTVPGINYDKIAEMNNKLRNKSKKDQEKRDAKAQAEAATEDEEDGEERRQAAG